jgi:NAD(P)-dependent dehydrogenase (short-subunit alcohol dehydrogenase family)
MSNALNHPALAAGRTAVVTGGAAGIGFAAAYTLAKAGMNVCIVDCREIGDSELEQMRAVCSGELQCYTVDVADAAEVARLSESIVTRFGDVGLLMNNAAIGGKRGTVWSGEEGWTRAFATNLIGVVNCVTSFVPAMLQSGLASVIVNTGSKQGITNPPGDPAYNASKAALISLTESLAHDLLMAEQSLVTAHLLIPGFTYTDMIKKHLPTKPEGAWWPSQVADAMVGGIVSGDFYILCEDNDVTRAMDERRIMWDALDIIENRPALSRWHPRFADEFANYIAGE